MSVKIPYEKIVNEDFIGKEVNPINQQDIYKMDLITFAQRVLLYYGITVVAYGVIAYILHSYRYAKAKKSLKCYYHNLKKLNSLYEE